MYNPLKDVRTDVAVYVTSFDGYSDLWVPFFECFWRHWPDCPFKVYLGGNSKGYDDDRVTFLGAQMDQPWSNRVVEHLEQIDSSYVIMFLEDWFLTKPVDSTAILEMFRTFETLNGRMLRFVPDPAPSKAIGGCPEFGLLELGQLNRTNTHATLWKKTTLLSLLKQDESLWEFEVFGAARSNAFSGGMYSVWQRGIYYLGAVDAGKYTREALRYAKKKGLFLDLSKRSVKSIRETFSWKTGNLIKSLTRTIVPLRARQRVKKGLLGAKAFKLRK